MNQSIKGFRCVQKGAEYPATIIHEVINCFFETISSMYGGALFLESELKRVGLKKWDEHRFEQVFEDF